MGIPALRQYIDATMPVAPISNGVQICSVYNFQILFRGLFLQFAAHCLRMRTDSVRQQAMRIIKKGKKHRSYCSVSPIRQDITYSFCITGAETEIRKIKDDSKIDRETNLDRRGPSQIGTDWHFPDPCTFSLRTTFKGGQEMLSMWVLYILSIFVKFFLFCIYCLYFKSFTFRLLLKQTVHCTICVQCTGKHFLSLPIFKPVCIKESAVFTLDLDSGLTQAIKTAFICTMQEGYFAKTHRTGLGGHHMFIPLGIANVNKVSTSYHCIWALQSQYVLRYIVTKYEGGRKMCINAFQSGTVVIQGYQQFERIIIV